MNKGTADLLKRRAARKQGILPIPWR